MIRKVLVGAIFTVMCMPDWLLDKNDYCDAVAETLDRLGRNCQER